MQPERVPSASLFAALGDETRLGIVARLCDAGQMSIAELTAGSSMTRQAVTKHLRVMEKCGLVHSSRHGRERRWQLERGRLEEARHYLADISKQWDDKLRQLQAFVDSRE
jgi:DNA-binding transcriptional ArsR family regulator